MLFENSFIPASRAGTACSFFSQFVQVLQLLKAELEAAGLGFCYLDGSSKDRMAQVDRFQDDDTVPVFLISLKAGGTGLNLTGADVVVHFDPWWNPAAEAQASDRAHRIGQNKQGHHLQTDHLRNSRGKCTPAPTGQKKNFSNKCLRNPKPPTYLLA